MQLLASLPSHTHADCRSIVADPSCAWQPGSCAFLRGHPQLLGGCLAALLRAPAQAQLLPQLLDAFLDAHMLLQHSPGRAHLCQVCQCNQLHSTSGTKVSCLAAVLRAPAQAQLLPQLLGASLDAHVLLGHSPGRAHVCQVCQQCCCCSALAHL